MPPPESPPTARCWHCGIQIDAPDHYCRHCGKGQGSRIPWYYHPAGLALLTVTALGPFVLPLVWKSPMIGRRSKTAATAAIAAFTLYVGLKLVELYRAFASALAGLQG